MALQETWLYKDEVHRPDSLHKDYASFSVSSVDESQELRRGRPFGGVTFLWHKSLSKYITLLDLQDSRMIGIKYKDENINVLFLNVYLPTNTVDNRDEG